MTSTYPDLLCAVDLSRRSRLALTYAVALTDHFKARLRILTVTLASADADTRHNLAQFVADATGGQRLRPAPDLLVRSGEPGDVILQIAAEPRTDLIVMSKHGDGRARGAYGSTSAHVLAHATVPVLVAPSGLKEPPAIEVSALLAAARTILAPIDFNERACHDAAVAAGIAEAFGVPLLLVHVLPPGTSTNDLDARAALERVAGSLRACTMLEPIVAHGDPALEIARLATVRQAGAIVMGLRGDEAAAGAHPGSIAYAVLCHAPALVLALPPALDWRARATHAASSSLSPV